MRGLKRVLALFSLLFKNLSTEVSLWKQYVALTLVLAMFTTGAGMPASAANVATPAWSASTPPIRPALAKSIAAPPLAMSKGIPTVSPSVSALAKIGSITPTRASIISIMPRLSASTTTQSIGASTISSNFNGTPIAPGSYIWFNSVVSVSGISNLPARLKVSGGVISFTANGQPTTIVVPDSVITYSSTALTASTQYDPSLRQWNTVIPVSLSGNAMLTSVPVFLPAALPGGINPVNWKENFYSDQPGLSVQWKWAAAVYTSFSADPNSVGAKPVDGSISNPYPNSDHAGTPESFKAYVVGGARGGGGSNWTGSYSGTASVAVPLDSAPTADAGTPQTVPVGTVVILDGSKSTDVNGDPLTYSWTIVSAPVGSTAQISDSSAVNPKFTIDKPGNYTLQLVVNDGFLASTPAQVTISTSNSAPVAVAGGDQQVLAGTPIQLDGSKSYDIDGDALTYKWTLIGPQGSGSFLSDATSARPTFTPDTTGDFVATLVVNDGTLDSKPASVAVTSGDRAPVAVISNVQPAKVGSTVTLDGTKSYDPDRQLITYQWSINTRAAGSVATLSDPSSPQPTITIDKPGTYVVQLIVSDGILQSDPVTVDVNTTNTPPIANAGVNQALEVFKTVQLDGSKSTDADGDSLTYTWALVNQPSGSTAQLSDPYSVKPTFVPDQVGTYIAQLTVSDGQANNTATATISSEDISPVANPGIPPKFYTGDTVTLDGSASSAILGHPLTYQWWFISVPTGSNATLTNADTVSPSFVADAKGIWVVGLRVNDGYKDSSVATLTLSTSNSRPIANAGLDQSVTNNSVVQLNGSQSIDIDQDPLTYKWSILSHPTGSISTFDNATAAMPAIVADVTGTYVFQLIVSDGSLDSAPVTVVITSHDPNKAPVVSAGPAKTANYPDAVNLEGSVTDDGLPIGAPLTILWTEINGPGNATFADSSNPTTSITFDKPGQYVLKLSANDSELESSSTVTVTYNQPQNQAPVVSAGPDDSGNAPQVYQLHGTVTDDGYPLNGKLTMLWTQVSGPDEAVFSDAMVATPIVHLNSAGPYVLKLTATDGELSSSATLTLTMTMGNKPPVVNAGPDQILGLPNANATLTGTVSDDGLPTGSTITVQWSQLSGPAPATFTSATSLQTGISFTTAGLYTLQLTASDSELKGSAVVHVKVNPQNLPPVVSAGPNQTIQMPINTVTLSGSMTDDGLPTAGTLTSKWSVASGPGQVIFGNNSKLVSTAAFATAGSYVLQLTGNDGQLSSSSTTTVTVVAAPPIAGGATLVLSPSIAGPNVVNSSQTLSATLKDGSGSPIAGVSIALTVTGANTYTSSSITNSSGQATFTYTSTNSGTDTVLASTIIGADQLGSNNATISWVHPTQPISTTDVVGQFFPGSVSSFNVAAGTTPYFTQHFPTINFNPQSGTVPGNTQIGVNTRPMTDVTTDLNGNFTGTIVAQGNGYQAGVNADSTHPLFDFQTVLTGTFTVAQPGNITFNFYSDDGFIFGIGGGATRVSGVFSGVPASGKTPFQLYPVVGAFNTPTAPSANSVTVNFPAAGSYPYEVDYFECCGGQIALTMTTTANGGHGVPPSGSLILSPNSVTAKNIGQSQTFSVSVTDAAGNVQPNVPVSLTITGPNLNQIISTTNASGVATFNYQGLRSGTDSIQARATLTGSIAYSNVVSVPWNNAANQAPVVNAGSNQTITLPALATVAGTATDDGLPNGTLTTTWTMVSGPGIVTFGAADQQSTQASFSTAGTYQLQLAATDGILTTTSRVTITVNPQPTPNKPPVVSAGPSISAFVNDTVAMNGSVNDDGLPTGAAVTSTWTKVSGPGNVVFANPSLAATSATFDQPGNYVLQLTGSDTQYSAWAQASFSITQPSTTPDKAPNVSLTAPSTVVLPNSATLTANVTDDGLPNNSLSYLWSAIAGPGTVTFASPTSSSTAASFSAPGMYSFSFAASDSQYTTSVSFSVSVVAAQTTQNIPPTVNAGPSKSITLPTTSVSLAGIVSDDGLPSGNLTLLWKQVSGPGVVTFANASTASTLATFPTAGVYQLQLSATDGQYTATSTTTVSLSATAGANQPPSLSVSAAGTIYLPSSTASLQAAVADDGLPSGGAVSLLWRVINGPTGGASIVSPTQASTQVTFSLAGSYTFQLSASDTQLTTTATLTVNVQAQPDPKPVVQLSLPDGVEIKNQTEINGSISSGNWTLSYVPLNGDGTLGTPTIVKSGTAPSSGVLGTLDPTMILNGSYLVVLTSQDQWGQVATTSGSVDVDRNLKIGNFTLSFNDLSVPMPGLPIQVTRTYDSRNHSVGDFGYGWTLSLANVKVSKSQNFGQSWYEDVTWSGYFPQYCLTAPSNRRVTFTFPDGKVYKFQAASNPQCQQFTPIDNPSLAFTQQPTDASTAGAKLVPDGDTPALLSGSIPGPVDLLEYNGNYVDVTKFKLTTADGYIYYIDQNLGVTRVQDPNGNTLTIAADGVTHSSGQKVAFIRDGQNRITSIQDLNGKSVSYAYSGSGDLQSVTARDNNTTTFSYDPDHPHYLAGIKDPRGVDAVKNSYDDSGRLISTTDANGKTITYDHRLALNQEAITDRLGNVTVYTYDNDGNVTKTEDAEGGVTEATYDAMGNKTSDKNNVVTKPTFYTYDALGNRLSETDPLGHKTTSTYNTRKQVTDIVDAKGIQTHNVYDTSGNLKSTEVIGSGVPATGYQYGANGMPSQVTDASRANTYFTYDGKGNVLTQKDDHGTVTTFTYDSNGNKKTQSVKRTKSDGTNETLLTQYEYDDSGRLTKTIYPDLNSVRTVYNSIGKQSDVYDALNHHTQYEYDDTGRLTKVTYNDDPNTYEHYTYDLEGRKLTSRDRAGHITQFVYDKVGRLKQTIAPNTPPTQTDYDTSGRVIASTDANGNPTTYGYDDAGRRTSVTDALGHLTSFSYDNAGNQISMTDASLRTTYYDYDMLNRRYRVRYPDGTNEHFNYDASGRMTDKFDQAGKHTNYVYDSLGRLTDVYLAPETLNLHTHYDYDQLGNRVAQIDGKGNKTSFAYDSRGRRSSRTLPLLQSESYTYDSAGNLSARTDFNGLTTHYFYDAFNRLTCKTPSASGDCADSRAVNCTYTLTGRRSTMTDPSGQTIYFYDSRDRLQSKQTPFGTLSYTYDNASNLLTTSSSNVNGASVVYSYDTNNRLSTVTDNTAAMLGATKVTTSYGYDAVGNLATVEYPNQVTTTYSYNLLNRLTQVAGTTPNATLGAYRYTLGAAGNRTGVVEFSGRAVSYVYDDIYRLTSESISAVQGSPYQCGANQCGALNYTYDEVGNRKQMTSTLGAIPAGLWDYDANDRFKGLDTYDANGNFSSVAGSAIAYDFENHLTQKDNISIVYDGDGNRVSKTVAGITTNYLVDTNNLTGYAQVLDELQNGQVVRSYTYGLDLISEVQPIGSDPTTATWQLSYYGYDGHGSVRYLTNAAGAVTDTYDYDAFGNIIDSTGSTPNNYLYSGEQYDPDLGLYYNRARYLDVRVGRFWGMDSVEGAEDVPISLHRFLYANANPAGFLDPTGHEGIVDTVQTMAFQATIFVMSHPILTTVATAVLLSLAPDEFLNSIPPDFGGPELQMMHSVEAEATEITTIRKLLTSGDYLSRFKAGRDFEQWMMTKILVGIEKEAVQWVVKDGKFVEGQARVAGSAVIDTIIRGVIYEFKTSFGAAKKYQAQEFAKFAVTSGRAMEYVFLHKPSVGEVEQLRSWIREVSPDIRFAVTYILK
jgi:RHS repeat-associated protein